MKHILWLTVLFVFIPISMTVANPYQEEPTMSFAIKIPHEITRDYLYNEDPEKCLVPLEIIPLGYGKAGLVPFVTVAEKRQIFETGNREGIIVRVEALMCLCENHHNNRVVIIRALDEKGVMQLIWTNPDVLKNKKEDTDDKPRATRV